MSIACGSGTPASPSATGAQSRTGAVDGTVYHESYSLGRLPVPAGPLDGAQVVVTEGAGAGSSFTTGSDGAYHFDLPPGAFRVRWASNGYESRESDVAAVVAGETTRLPTVTLRLLSNVPIPEWSVSGLVVDGRGNPVPSAFVSLFTDITRSSVAGTQTDASGHFLLTSTRQHGDTVSLDVNKPGYVPTWTPVACAATCATTTVRLLRIVREWLDAPSSMQVGDVAPVSALTEYDDGSRTVGTGVYTLRSSNPSVVQVQPSPAEGRVYVKALAAGMATLTLGQLTQAVSVYR